MIQNYLMYIKIMIHRKRFYLWNLIVPIMLGLLLYVITENLTKMEEYVPLNVGVVTSQEQGALVTRLTEAKDSYDQPLFDVQVVNEKQAEAMLGTKELDAYVVPGEKIQLYVNREGVSQSLLKVWLEQYQKELSLVQTADSIFQNQASEESEFNQILRTNEGMNHICSDNSMIYFYTLIGVCCFLAISFGYYLAELLLANQSKLAKRLLCTPSGIYTRFFTGILAALTVDLFCVIVVMCFIRYILGYNLIFENYLVWGITIAGILFGILTGYVIRSLLGWHRMWKDPIAMALIIISGFFAGIIRSDVRYLLNETVPWVNYVNPVALISDGLYSIYYQGNVVSYIKDVVILVAGIVIFMIASLVQTGRRAYERL